MAQTPTLATNLERHLVGGFTLIELLVVLAVSAVALTLATLNWRVATARPDQALRDCFAELQTASQRAYTSGQSHRITMANPAHWHIERANRNGWQLLPPAPLSPSLASGNLTCQISEVRLGEQVQSQAALYFGPEALPLPQRANLVASSDALITLRAELLGDITGRWSMNQQQTEGGQP